MLSLLSAGAGHGDTRVAVTAHGRWAWLPRWRRRERRRKRTRGKLGLGPALPWCVRSCVRHLLAAGLELRRRRIRGGRPAGGRSRLSGDLAVRDRMADLFLCGSFYQVLAWLATWHDATPPTRQLLLLYLLPVQCLFVDRAMRMVLDTCTRSHVELRIYGTNIVHV